MHIPKRYLLIGLLGLSVQMLQAQVRKYSNEFLNIGVGARALGMSNSVVAHSQDATSAYWNPAGMLGIQSNIQLAAMHAEYFAGISNYDYAGLVARSDSNTVLGFSLIRFGVDNIPNTTELINAQGNIDYSRITTFSAVDYAFMFSLARKTKIKGLQVGANAKVIRRKVGDFGGAWGFGLDAGLQYAYKGWKLGAVARDVTSTFNAWSYTLNETTKNVFAATGNEIPSNSVEVTLPRLILAAGRTWMFFDKLTVLAELNTDMTFDGKRNVLIRSNPISFDPHAGLELGYRNLFFVRGGLGNIQQVKNFDGKQAYTLQPNFGVGIKLKALSIDYALTDIGNSSDALYSNIFSLKLDINRKTK